ncbi:lantibiotic dehydratase [Clostridium sp. JS66]|uniref:lantibiotic dehydratase n=1 Tax=Clostridium sp. JS66 TaxID=3064705 RepID=UPI00298E885C|nr:lantibiotic dehydratase [Clostridium sp. JS66]WPC44135.1 lantibiotic dehydratase [Clostridium sp. JS66]
MSGTKCKSNKNIFETKDFFMLRTPILPVNMYNYLFDESLSTDEMENKLFELAENSIIKEAIAVSSLSLSESLVSMNEGISEKKKKKILSSLLKYFIRMTTRTTPFGLFSGVTLGEFCDKTEIKLKEKRYYIKRARPDMGWLCAIIRNIESDKKILNELNLITNNMVLINGTRLDLVYISNYGQNSKEKSEDNLTASIRYNTTVKLVMKLAKSEITYKELLSKLKYENQSTPVERIENFLDVLIKNEYLLTEMRPPLANTSPFEYILSKLENIEAGESLYLKLKRIKELIDIYNTTAVGNGEKLYKDIVKSMSALEKSDNYLQVDLRLKEEKAALNSEVAEEIEKVVEIMLRLSNKSAQFYHLERYKTDFIEKYGTDSEISVIELLDPDKGIGAPSGYENPKSNKYIGDIPDDYKNKKFENYLVNKVMEALLNKEQEVIITDEDIDNIDNKPLTEFTKSQMPKSLEINALISAKSEEAIDKGDFKVFIGPNVGSNRAGKTFGRFVDILPREIYAKLNQLNDTEKSIYGDETVLSEIVELPQNMRNSNVCLNWSPRDYEVAIATNYSGKKKNISVSDLYIGIDRENKDNFYIKSKTLNKKVIISCNHMLNPTYGSNIYRFLREVSLSNTTNLMETFYITQLDYLNYCPRIRYSKVIISPAKWKLSNDILNVDAINVDIKSFCRAIKLWRKKWKVPQFVYQKMYDNRLLLNLENELHLNELLNLLKKEKEIIITEIEDGLDKLWTRGEDGKYFSEIVVPVTVNKQFLKNVLNENNIELQSNVLQTKSDYRNNLKKFDTLDKKVNFIPGDEWIYMKLYGISRRVDEFIGYNLLPFCKELIMNREIEKFFYIRYSDPEYHIRLRLKGNSTDFYSAIMPKLNLWFKKLIKEGLLSKVSLDVYSREMERYGGPSLIDLAEDVFYVDSIFVSNIISLKRSKQLRLDLNYIAVASIINFMDEMKLDYKTQNEIFINRFDKNRYRELFQENRKVFMKMANSDNDWSSLKEIEEGQCLYNLFKIRKEKLNIFADKMNELDEENKLCNSKLNIILSIMHMFCNRLFGTVKTEEKIMCLVRHTLHSLEYIKNINSK